MLACPKGSEAMEANCQQSKCCPPKSGSKASSNANSKAGSKAGSQRNLNSAGNSASHTPVGDRRRGSAAAGGVAAVELQEVNARLVQAEEERLGS